MMKKRFNSPIALSVLLTLTLVSPSLAYAKDEASSRAGSLQTSFCASLDLATQKIDQNILAQEDKYAVKEKEREVRIIEKMGARERATQGIRLDTDVTHDKVFVKLVAHSRSEEDKTAIGEFKQGLDRAIAKRRESVDAAVKTFNTESAKLIALRERDIDNATTTLRNATIKAANSAKINCKNGLAGTTVRARYARDLKNARLQFQADITSALRRNEGISTLIKNRDADIKTAVDEFKDALSTLRLDLESTLETN